MKQPSVGRAWRRWTEAEARGALDELARNGESAEVFARRRGISPLYHNRFRTYDPVRGDYISQDPIRLAGGFSLYGYVSRPEVEIDPFGLKACNIDSKRVAALQGQKNPDWGKEWHMHHIVMEGKFSRWKPENLKFIKDAEAILVKHKVSLQVENVVWANSVAYAKEVYQRLAKADATGGGATAIKAELEAIGRILGAGQRLV